MVHLHNWVLISFKKKASWILQANRWFSSLLTKNKNFLFFVMQLTPYINIILFFPCFIVKYLFYSLFIYKLFKGSVHFEFYTYHTSFEQFNSTVVLPYLILVYVTLHIIPSLALSINPWTFWEYLLKDHTYNFLYSYIMFWVDLAIKKMLAI